jgi:predicted Zn-dependent peptidase
MLSIVLLLARLTVWGPGDGPESPPEVATQAQGAAVAVHRQPAVPVVSVRLSILATDPAGYAGAGHMIQHLLYPGLRDRAARIGARVQMERTSDAVVYTITGPATELEYISQLLLTTLLPPQLTLDGLLSAERELKEERLAEWETAPSHVRSSLRAQVFPEDLSAAGTDRSATRFSITSMPRIWGEMYHPERVSVVAVGDVFLGDVQRVFATLPDPTQPRQLGIQRDSVELVSLAPAEATRGWFGAAYLAGDLNPAAVTVTGRLLREMLAKSLPTAQVEAEHWWTHYGQALALIVAVPQPQIAAARRQLGTAMATLLDDVDFLTVAEAAAAVRREMLFYSRTPDRMAEVIGEFVDRGGDANGTERFYADLDALDDEDVREVLEVLLDRTPARVELPPQALQPRRP